MFCVADDWQRRGLGSRLLGLLVDTAVTDAMRWCDGVIPEQAPFATIYLHAGQTLCGAPVGTKDLGRERLDQDDDP